VRRVLIETARQSAHEHLRPAGPSGSPILPAIIKQILRHRMTKESHSVLQEGMERQWALCCAWCAHNPGFLSAFDEIRESLLKITTRGNSSRCYTGCRSEHTCFSCDRRLASRIMCSLSSFHSLALKRTSSTAVHALRVPVTSSASRCCFSMASSPSKAPSSWPCTIKNTGSRPSNALATTPAARPSNAL
jgi:hypothetical protein